MLPWWHAGRLTRCAVFSEGGFGVLGRPCAPRPWGVMRVHAPLFEGCISSITSLDMHGQSLGDFCPADLGNCVCVEGTCFLRRFLGPLRHVVDPAVVLKMGSAGAHAIPTMLYQYHSFLQCVSGWSRGTSWTMRWGRAHW